MGQQGQKDQKETKENLVNLFTSLISDYSLLFVFCVLRPVLANCIKSKHYLMAELHSNLFNRDSTGSSKRLSLCAMSYSSLAVH